MADDTTRLKSLLFEALQQENREKREAFVREECRGDRGLEETLRALIEAHEQAGDYLGGPPRAACPLDGEAVEGSVIGHYKLLEQIGEGGFGVVFVAEQREPVKRRVALKIIKLGMDTRQVIARFEAERQALALMDHPNIAKVLDAGATETGRPYFVMELVRGMLITQFCEENRLTLKERLQLFIQVCQAIQHAHQKGVIHRDVKPSNILVRLNDGVAHPMVIDFGVAKAIDQRLTEKTLYTRFAQMIGTPAYMSPEQAATSKQGVDTRTDVYSLGILLYELLTGTTPFPEERLREAGYAEIQRIISEEEPVRPSTTLSRLNGPSRAVAASRRCEPASLIKHIRGDLDWIVLKAIDKDRNRRYETTDGLAADLQRYLSDEPVTASPPSALYQLSKFARRHRTSVVAGVTVLLVLVLGIILTTWQAHRATKAEKLARERLALAEAQRAKADEKSREALENREEAEAVNRWLLQSLLGIPDHGSVLVGVERKSDITLKEALLKASGTLEEYLSDQPARRGRISMTIGEALERLNLHSEGRELVRQGYELLLNSLGAVDWYTLYAENTYGESLVDAFYRPNGGGSKRERGLGEEGMRLVEDAYAKRKQRFGAEDPFTLHGAFTLGRCHLVGACYGSQSDLARAEALIPGAAAAVERIAQSDSIEHFELKTRAFDSLLSLRLVQGRITEARKLTERALALRDQRRRATGEDTPYDIRFANYHCQLGWLDLIEGEYDLAAKEALKGLEISLKQVGHGYPTENLLFVLRAARWRQGRFEEAAEAGRRYLEIQEEAFGPQHVETRLAGRGVVNCYAKIADWAAASAELARQRERGTFDGRSLACEVLISHLMHEVKTVPKLRETFWQWARDHAEAGFDYHTLLLILALPLPETERDQVLALARQGLSSSSTSEWSEEQKAFLPGLVAYRSGQFSEAVTQLQPVAHNLANRRIAALARFFVALAINDGGRTVEA